MGRGGICSDAAAMLVCCGEERFEPEGKALNSLVSFHSFIFSTLRGPRPQMIILKHFVFQTLVLSYLLISYFMKYYEP